MNYFTKIPDEIKTKILTYLNYNNLLKINIIDKSSVNHYNTNKKRILNSLIKNYGYKLVENSTSLNFQKPNYTLSINKNHSIDNSLFLEGYLSLL